MSDQQLGVIWDMDGVLVDSGEFHYQSWQLALDEVGVPFNRELFRQTFGMNNRGILTYLLKHAPDPDFFQRISDRKENWFREAIRGQAQALPGVRQWLARNQAAGARQAVASSAPQANVDVLIAELKIAQYFDALLSAFDLPGKPDPAVFLKAAQAIGLPPARCVVVEDAITGVEAARRAGMKCIAVTTTNPASALGQAQVIVDRLDQLPEGIFQKMIA